MKLILALILTLLLAGCATTEATHSSPDGFTVSWKSTTLFKDVKDAEATWGDFSARLGSSASQQESAMLACLIAPQLDGCN